MYICHIKTHRTMDYIVSARKYRPSTFDSVVGQSALTTTLKNAIANKKLAHAYLFCGPRGVGKTTCARIFAKTINCLQPTADGEACNECESCKAFNEQRSYNIHELDAASNNSVEDIRSLIEQVRIPPQIGKYKVYIIDEVHMLSSAAFNAFLKTLEEPPAHAIFILATTEKHKILPTILSRCQIYDFNRIGVSDTVGHLENVARKEGIEAEPEALNVIAQKADGGMRDALSIFDQVVSFTNGHITYQSVIENLNVLDYEYYFKLTDYFLHGKVAECLLLFNDVLQKGFDANHFITGLTSHLRDLLVSRDAQTLPLLEVGASIRERYRQQAQQCPPKFLFRAMKLSNDCDMSYRTSKNKRLLVELTLIQLAQLTSDDGDDGVAGRSPAQKIRPIFTQQPSADHTVQAAPPQASSQPQPKVAAPRPAEATPVPATTDTPASVHTSLLPKQEPVKKIPVMKKGEMNISLRHPKQNTSEETKNPLQHTAVEHTAESDAAYEDYIINDHDLGYYWRDFASKLPQEEAANAARMMNMQPQLKENATFEIVVDNDMVRRNMQALSAHIEQHLRQSLHNRNIRMMIRVREADENVRAYSQLERYQLMSKKNPDLLALKEAFGLELV